MRTQNRTVFLVVFILFILGGLTLYNFVLGPTEDASGPIEAVPVQIDPTSPPPTSEPIDTETPPETTQQPVNPTPGGIVVYEINQDESQVSFSIYEELRGQPKDVVGITNQISGQIAVERNNLDATQVGEIRVNARTLLTDVDRRNRAIRNFILNTDQYEFIIFTPTSLTGLSGNAVPGESISFQINGDLTIRDITQPVTFEVSAQLGDNNQLIGTATTVINRGQFNLTIPNVPGVANVGEEVTLTINFSATETSGS